MSFTNMTVLSHGRTICDEFLFPGNEYEARIGKVSEIIDKEGLDGLLIYTNSLSRGNVCYLTGFSNFLSWSVSMVILPKGGKPILVATIAPRDIAFTSKLLPEFVEIVAAGLSLVSNEHISVKTIEYMKENGLLSGKKWGSVNFDCLPYMADAPWKEVFPGGIPDCSKAYYALRSRKSDSEMYVISQASAMAKRAAYEYMRQAQPGVSETILASKIDRELRINGANTVSILTGADKSGGASLHVPRERCFEDGDTVCIFADIGLQGYHGSFGATKIIGSMSTQQESLFAKAHQLWDGKLADMLETKESIVGWHNAVCGEYEYYTIVNGIGCDLVEYPDQYGSEAKLESGMTITLSMNVQKEGAGAVFMSENFLVAENSFIPMSGPGK